MCVQDLESMKQFMSDEIWFVPLKVFSTGTMYLHYVSHINDGLIYPCKEAQYLPDVDITVKRSGSSKYRIRSSEQELAGSYVLN